MIHQKIWVYGLQKIDQICCEFSIGLVVVRAAECVPEQQKDQVTDIFYKLLAITYMRLC